METPRGLLVAAGFVVVIAGSMAAATVPRDEPTVRLVVLAGVVAVFAAVADDVVAVLATAGMAWPFYSGFLDGRLGVLHWDGSATAVHVAVLVAAGLLGYGATRLRGNWIHRW